MNRTNRRTLAARTRFETEQREMVAVVRAAQQRLGEDRDADVKVRNQVRRVSDLGIVTVLATGAAGIGLTIAGVAAAGTAVMIGGPIAGLAVVAGAAHVANRRGLNF